MIYWPDLIFPPINLWTAPYYENRRCLGLCDKTGQYCKNCHRLHSDFGEYDVKEKTRQTNH